MNSILKTNKTIFNLNIFKKDFFSYYFLIKSSFRVYVSYFFAYKKFLNEYWNARETHKIIKFLKKKILNIVAAFTAKKYKQKFISIKYIFSPNNLYNAFIELKNLVFLKDFNNITVSWFKKTSKELIKGDFKYFKRKQIQRVEQYSYKNFQTLVFQNFKIQIIEKALLNSLEPVFEGLWAWTKLNTKNKKLIKFKHLKKQKMFTKQYIYEPKFMSLNYNFRAGKSIHFTLKKLKDWNKNLVWVLNYEIYKSFTFINQNRLKNIFLFYVHERQIWKEIKNLFKCLNINSWFNSQSFSKSRLINLLYNLYLTELDFFVQKLSKLLIVENNTVLLKTNKNYNLIARSFYEKYKNKYLNKQFILQTKPDCFLLVHSNKIRTKLTNILNYIRYKNNFLISLNLQRRLALKIQQQIDMFIKSDLHLNIKLSQLKNRHEKYVKFINYKIYVMHFQKKKFKYVNFIYANIKKLNRKLWKANAFKIKKKYSYLLKEIELTKKFGLLKVKKLDFLKKTKLKLNYQAKHNTKIIINGSFTWLINFLNFKKYIRLNNNRNYSFLNVIFLLINNFRITKNFYQFKKLIIWWKKQNYKNANIIFPSLPFVNSIKNKFTIFKNGTHVFSSIQKKSWLKNKCYNENFYRNVKFL